MPQSLEQLLRQPGSPIAPDIARLSDAKRNRELKWNARVREGAQLHPREVEFLAARSKFVARSMSLVFGAMGGHGIPRVEPEDAPNVALVCSGGGCRAMIASGGNVQALSDAGLLDCVTYWGGVSGATWCMASYYTNANPDGVKGVDIDRDLDEWDVDLNGGVVRFTPGKPLGLLEPWWSAVSTPTTPTKEADWWTSFVKSLNEEEVGKYAPEWLKSFVNKVAASQEGTTKKADSHDDPTDASNTGERQLNSPQGGVDSRAPDQSHASVVRSHGANIVSQSDAKDWLQSLLAKVRGEEPHKSTETQIGTAKSTAVHPVERALTPVSAQASQGSRSPDIKSIRLSSLPYPAVLDLEHTPSVERLLWHLKEELNADFMSITRTLWMVIRDPVVAQVVGEIFLRKIVFDHPDATIPPINLLDIWSSVLTARLLLSTPRTFPPGPGDQGADWTSTRFSRLGDNWMLKSGKVPFPIIGITGELVEASVGGETGSTEVVTPKAVEGEVVPGGAEGAGADPTTPVRDLGVSSFFQQVEVFLKSVGKKEQPGSVSEAARTESKGDSNWSTAPAPQKTSPEAAKSVESSGGNSFTDRVQTLVRSTLSTTSKPSSAETSTPVAAIEDANVVPPPKATFQFYEFNPFEFSRVERGKEVGVPVWAFGRRFEKGKSIVVKEPDGEEINAVAMPEMPFGYMLGIGSSAFMANLAKIYEAFEADMPLGIKDKVKSLVEPHGTFHLVEPALVRNPFFGMEHLPSDLASEENLMLMDGGMQVNTPFLQMLREGRNVDVFIGMQHSADLYSRRMDLVSASVYALNNGIRFPYITIEDLPEKLMLEERVSVFRYRDYPQPRNDGTIPDVDEDGPDIVYFPLVKNPNLTDKTFSPITHAQCSTFNFAYSRDTTDKLFETAKLNVEEGVDVIRTILREKWERKKAKRERSQQTKAAQGGLFGWVSSIVEQLN
ncbi:FabD/lysophospholipase-like protein [Gonapodya prolifera JEL478]|uniref:Lysophospholipase n=1 Tax=Gonapodya prolifera (strain JEL478) TaxID=1344416 RepID=A0A139AN02_GONPJ|nr:FabD/lysophospholipase-like protein [Gonapodya prolifera JEL478]|eukprot:KXS18129.1 FabD/lysophospholipase-like protein [Gonapodya prolifera JEL478]